MTVTSLLTSVERPGNGSATEFSFAPVRIFDETQLEVVVRTADGALTTVPRGTGSAAYAVVASFREDEAVEGSILYPESGGSPLPTGAFVSIRRVIPSKQLVDIQNQGGYLPEVQERLHDEHVMRAQQLAEEMERSVKVPFGSATDPEDYLGDAANSAAAAEASAAAAEASAAAAEASAAAAAVFNPASVAITGGSITGITDLAIADGGTGASTAVDARANLGVKNPTTQYLTSGTAATYTTPAGATKLFIRMVGGGGGGGAANGTPTVGSAGGDTSFNSIVAKGGAGGGIGTQASGGAGGASGTGTAKIRIAGENGGRYFTNGNYTMPSVGGRSFFGGNGSAPNPGSANVGISAAANSGSGGSGAASGSSAGGGGGGGAGEYVEFEIATPSASYTYTVGAGGARGTGDQGGGDGGSGLIIVTEYYN